MEHLLFDTKYVNLSLPFWYYLPIYILCCHIFMLCTTDHFATIYSCMLFTHLWENYYVLAQENVITLTIAGLITLTHQKSFENKNNSLHWKELSNYEIFFLLQRLLYYLFFIDYNKIMLWNNELVTIFYC